MKLYNILYSICIEYYMQLELCYASSKKEFDKQHEAIVARLKKEVNRLRDLFPHLVQVNYEDHMSASEADNIIGRIANAVKGTYYTSLPYADTESHEVAGKTKNIRIPFGEWCWQNDNAGDANTVFQLGGTMDKQIIEEMKAFIMNMLLSLPCNTVHLDFVDLNFTGFGTEFTSNLDENICSQPITSPHAFSELLTRLSERHTTIVENLGNLPKQNEFQQTFLYPYEVLVLLNYPKGYEQFEEAMSPLFEHGYKSGLYFVVLNTIEKTTVHNRILSQEDNYGIISDEDTIIKALAAEQLPFAVETPIYKNTTLREAAFRYFNENASQIAIQAKEEEQKTLVDTPYDNQYGVLTVPVGNTECGVADFALDDESHPHAFILGQSGSGKSVLMHNIISSLILKYAPEDLQLYLLDFKTGGVEFDRYRNVKHSKALLVDNSDIQITLEILRDIQNQMKERGKLFRKEGVSKISEYNKIHENDRLPSVVIIADECHVMFPSRNEKDRRIYNEISEIMSYIAKEGRSQGVHLVLATQNLDGADIPNDIIKNVTDHYLLKCAVSDSEKMVSNSSRITSKLNKGQVYCHHSEQSYQFTSFYHPKEELEYIIQQAIDKAKKCSGNGQFYFSGAQMFQINENTIEVLHKKGRKNPVVTGGLSINLTQEPVSITLKNDFSENILLFGINDQEQVNRTTMNLLVTLAISVKERNQDMDICVIDCLNDDEANYLDVLDAMEEKGLCRIINGRRRGEFLKQMVDAISEERATPTTIFVIGQERFREIKMDMPLEKKESMDLLGGMNFSSEKKIESYKDALQFILERGPECGVHTVLQIDKPDKILFNEYSMTQKELFSMFKHLVMLHSDENAASRYISNEIKLENISGDAERLRAYYYSEENDTYTLFVPYEMPTHQTLNTLFN